MSRASRLPIPAADGPVSYPVLVDRRTGDVNFAAIRAELRGRYRGPAAWSTSRVLAKLFAKVRLQRANAIKAIVERAADKARAERENAALDAEALAVAERHGFDTAALRFQRDRWAGGSLADTNRAQRQRDVYRRAFKIACERPAALDSWAA